MEITFHNHSSLSVLTETGLSIIFDPWFKSKVFNNSWSLLHDEIPLENSIRKDWLVCISHEHPDHFNIPTLKEYFSNNYILGRMDFREEVKNAAKKICRGFKGLETDTIHTLPSGDKIGIFPFHGDSCIYIEDGKSGEKILNFNDCEFDHNFLEKITKMLPSTIDIIAGQFGLAGWYGGSSDRMIFQDAKRSKLQRLRHTSELFKARIIIPFASFATFCKAGNAYINEHQTRPQEIYTFMGSAPGTVWLPLPGETLDLANTKKINEIKSSHNERSDFWGNLQSKKHELDDDQKACINDVKSSLDRLTDKLISKKIDISSLPEAAINIIIKSLNKELPCVFNFRKMSLEVCRQPYNYMVHFSIPSDEISYAFSYPWGADTLNITGSAIVKSVNHYRFFCSTLDAILKRAY